jgi:hypothetical protein
MRIRGVVATAVVACAFGWAGRTVFSEDAAPPAAPKEDEMTAMMVKLAQPGDEHARLAKALAGEWTVHGKFNMGGKEVESDSTSKIEPILDGRFVRQEVNGNSPFGPFAGRGIMGYNNGTKKFVGAWIDNMGTGIMTGTGVENDPGKCWTFTDSYDAGPYQMNMRDELKVVSADEFTMKMFHTEGGKEALGMELTYKRKK